MIKNIAMIVAISENNAIGKDNDLLCYLSADLKHFKEITMGHAIIMGRKTFESLPKGALPGRRNIVITRNRDFKADGVTVCHSIDDAIEVTNCESQRFIIGGAQLYGAMIEMVDTLYITRIHATFADANVFFPKIDLSKWTQLQCERHQADERNSYPFSFTLLTR
ncbi:MAG: dihydrofolate reductase [Muribaculaceae bacterium]